MRLLFLTSFPLGDLTSGQGLILTRITEALGASRAVEVKHALFRVHNRNHKEISPSDLFQTSPLFTVEAPSLNRLSIALGTIGLSGARDARNLARAIAQHSDAYDGIIWMGLPTDPVSAIVPQLTELPVLYYIVDSYALHSARRKSGSLDIVRAWMARRMEARILQAGYRGFIYVSQEDYDFALRLSAGFKSPPISLLPIGIDLKQWCPGKREAENRRSVVLFSGVMNFGPNIAAAKYFVHKVLPLIKTDFEFRIAGKDPTAEVWALAGGDPRITITGTVQDMVREYQKADLFVAPMIETAGIKIKLMQAMATGLPVVVTPSCMAAFPDPPESPIIAANAEAFAEAVDTLINNPTERIRRGQAGRRFVEDGWSWEARAAKFLEFARSRLQGKT